jgi:hypothetical protein
VGQGSCSGQMASSGMSCSCRELARKAYLASQPAGKHVVYVAVQNYQCRVGAIRAGTQCTASTACAAQPSWEHRYSIIATPALLLVSALIGYAFKPRTPQPELQAAACRQCCVALCHPPPSPANVLAASAVVGGPNVTGSRPWQLCSTCEKTLLVARRLHTCCVACLLFRWLESKLAAMSCRGPHAATRSA